MTATFLDEPVTAGQAEHLYQSVAPSLLDDGASINDVRRWCGLPPVEGGDRPVSEETPA